MATTCIPLLSMTRYDRKERYISIMFIKSNFTSVLWSIYYTAIDVEVKMLALWVLHLYQSLMVMFLVVIPLLYPDNIP